MIEIKGADGRLLECSDCGKNYRCIYTFKIVKHFDVGKFIIGFAFLRDPDKKPSRVTS